MDYLLRCYKTALRMGATFFEAQALQGLSEHALGSRPECERIARTLYGSEHENGVQMAGEMADRSLSLFQMYGDVYQMAGGARTLAKCYWYVQDYDAAIHCLEEALQTAANDTVRPIEQAPDLVASISEQLALSYSANGNIDESLHWRNIYLRLQEDTRQDRENEARAEELDSQNAALSRMMVVVGIAIGLLALLFFLFDYLRRRTDRKYSSSQLLQPLQQWTSTQQRLNELHNERLEQNREDTAVASQQLAENKRYNLEQRTKVSFLATIQPLIDRMHRELAAKDGALSDESKEYIDELAAEIERNNRLLTDWIQLRKGSLHLHVESFAVQELFDILQQSSRGFLQQGIDFKVDKTQAVVKADKILTLFMMNTMADNARKFTGDGGKVHVYAEEKADCVEISIADTGQGMEPEQVRQAFEHKIANGHGFGLMNCKGIIEQYKKASQLFSVASIGVESEKGRGSRFFFRLPKGMLRLLLSLMLLCPAAGMEAVTATAPNWVDSVETANSCRQFEKAIALADSAVAVFNQEKMAVGMPMQLYSDNGQAAEMKWMEWGATADFQNILKLRNQVAIAALGLRHWDLYTYNNRAYTQLLRKMTADNTIDDYVKTMRHNATKKNIAVVVLSILLLSMFPAYYFLFYRHRKAYVRNVRRLNDINTILLGEASLAEKLRQIREISASMPAVSQLVRRNNELSETVGLIEITLEKAVALEREQTEQMETSEEEKQRIKYESERLYVANSVIDNCLSTLKHETMYYPQRIRNLISAEHLDTDTLSATVDYYRQLYSLLLKNAQTQTSISSLHPVQTDISALVGLPQPLIVVADRDMAELLFTLLRNRLGPTAFPPQVQTEKNYATLTFEGSTAKQPNDQTASRDLLYCRQILRDMGDTTHARRCGIQVYEGPDHPNRENIQITLVYHGTI